MATTTKSRAARAAGMAAQDQQPQTPAPSETPKPKPEPKPELPTATGDVGARPVEYFFPSLTLADGTVIECSHRSYGHERRQIAEKCLRALAAAHGVKLA